MLHFYRNSQHFQIPIDVMDQTGYIISSNQLRAESMVVVVVHVVVIVVVAVVVAAAAIGWPDNGLKL